MSFKLSFNKSPLLSPTTTSLDVIPPSPLKSKNNNRASFPSLDRFKLKSYNSTSTFSTSDESSEGTVSSVPSRFVFNTVNPKSMKKNKLKAPRLYRPKKYLKRQPKEVSSLPHQLQILFERGTTPLSNNYQLLNRKLGDGAMGSVYLVQRKSDKKLFAAKLHTKDSPQLTQAQYLQQIADEVIIASSLHHDHIISTLDFVSNGPRYMTIMEYCPTDLFDLIKTEKFDTAQLDTYFVQLLLGVYHMHSHGIAHRDLKLENLCIDKQGKLKIIDFGCANEFRGPFEQNCNSVAGIYGSDPYIAPEVWSGRSYDPEKADLWSIAIIYVALHSGIFLWDKAIKDDKRYERFPTHVDSIFEKYKIPSHARSILKRLLDPNPYTRANIQEVMCQEWIHQILIGI
ncbi:kinase-like protein [Neoconidiobolus thromboides FSU 785]|nr:kinase-like protein [Neoconidiobolus thromboides FSU 785]